MRQITQLLLVIVLAIASSACDNIEPEQDPEPDPQPLPLPLVVPGRYDIQIINGEPPPIVIGDHGSCSGDGIEVGGTGPDRLTVEVASGYIIFWGDSTFTFHTYGGTYCPGHKPGMTGVAEEKGTFSYRGDSLHIDMDLTYRPSVEALSRDTVIATFDMLPIGMRPVYAARKYSVVFVRREFDANGT